MQENELRIRVWHFGEDTQTYVAAPALLAFRVEEDGEAILHSGRGILSRPDPHFRQGYRKKITPQLGFSWFYDATAPEASFRPSDEYGPCAARDRKIRNLVLRARSKARLSATGESVLADLGRETVGFLELELDSPIAQTILVAYGEHLRGGHVARRLASRDFSLEVAVGAGKSKLLIPHRRIAGRYLELFAERLSPENIAYAGIRPVVYPLRRNRFSFALPLDRAIYEASVYTLECCMHEHYEDCPWREQALYAMDSRNQMLCGYDAFRGAAFQRHSLLLLAKSLRADGLLAICAPSGRDAPIPFFSLVYPVQVAEYVGRTGDRSILREVGATLHTIMKTFREHIGENGLIPQFPAPFWNFYEWSEGNSHTEELGRTTDEGYEPRCDLILNCMYVYAAKHYDALFGTTTETGRIKAAIEEKLWDGEVGLYRAANRAPAFGQLGNALALLIGLGGEELAEKLARGENMVPITLSMTTFLYDSLLSFDEKRYAPFVLDDIRRRYGRMLAAGATTFWETESGAEDFGGAGSLCHGWSAMPAHYLTRLLPR